MPIKLPDSGFDRVAPFYDRLARLVYGNSLEQAQRVLLPFIPGHARVLVIGGGSGWILKQLLQTGKQLNILYLEAAPAMLRQAQKESTSYKHPHNCRIEFRLGTEQQLHPQEQFDVVFTPFLLDLFPPERLQDLMRRLERALKPEGLWLFTDFWPVQQPPPLWQQLLIQGMYVFFGWLSDVKAIELPDYAAHFTRLGFKEQYSCHFYRGMVQAKVFAHHLQN